jgi:hypothetical protein
MKTLKTGIATKIDKTGRVTVHMTERKFKHTLTGINFYSSDYWKLKNDIYHIDDNKHFRIGKLIK